MATKAHTKAAARRTLKPSIAPSDLAAPQAAPSSLTQGEVETLTEHLRDIQRLVRVCCAAGGNESQDFGEEIAETLEDEVLQHVWDALEIVGAPEAQP
jgi:hypothetical protein